MSTTQKPITCTQIGNNGSKGKFFLKIPFTITKNKFNYNYKEL